MHVRLFVLPAALLLACAPTTDGEPTDTDTDTLAGLPTTYAFTSQFEDASSVSYGGQTFRHLLIDDLKGHIGGLTARLDGGWFPTAGEVSDELDFYLSFDSTTSGDLAIGFASTPSPLQATYNDVSSDKDILGKLAGNDPVGQTVDWSGGIVGWPGAPTPEALVLDWVGQLDDQAVAWSNGTFPLDPDGVAVPAVFLTEEGLDLQQLLQKFLLGAVALSQGTDDYLDDNEPGKGLLSDHTAAEEGEVFTALEHAWDEAFGYFGASRDYGLRTDADISASATSDTVVADGAIDLKSEVSWGASANAAKRDAGSAASAPTDFTDQAFGAFLAGRHLLATTPGPLTDDDLDDLRAYRDEAVAAWEAAIAASVVHYINEVLVDLSTLGTDDYAFADHAKHFAELKGFALSLQFTPFSPLSAADQVTLHNHLGAAPTLDVADAPARATSLRAARTLLGERYGFDPANLGDDDGLNGW